MSNEGLDETLAAAARARAQRSDAKGSSELDERLLERYRCGLLTPEEAEEIERRLAANPHDRARLAELRSRPPERHLWRGRLTLSLGAVAIAAAAVLALSFTRPEAPSYALRGSGGEVLFDPELRYRGELSLPEILLQPEQDLVLHGEPRGQRAERVELFVERLDRLRPVARQVEFEADGSFRLRARFDDLLGQRSSTPLILVIERGAGSDVAALRFRTRIVRAPDG